jgi:hypothetical protein
MLPDLLPTQWLPAGQMLQGKMGILLVSYYCGPRKRTGLLKTNVSKHLVRPQANWDTNALEIQMLKLTCRVLHAQVLASKFAKKKQALSQIQTQW